MCEGVIMDNNGIEYWRTQLKKIEWSEPKYDIAAIDELCDLAKIGYKYKISWLGKFKKWLNL